MFDSIQFVKELIVHFSDNGTPKIRVSTKKNPSLKYVPYKGEFLQQEGQTRVEIDTFCSSINVASELLGFASVDIKQIEIFIKTEEDLEGAKDDLSKAEKIKETLQEKTKAAHESIEKEKLKLVEALP